MMTYRINFIMAISLTALWQELQNLSYKYKIQVCSLRITVILLAMKALIVCPSLSHLTPGGHKVI